PYARHVEFLRERFGANPAVQIFPVALGSRDETTVLHIAQNQAGEDYEPYHTLVQFNDNSDLLWGQDVAVECRSLCSMVQKRELPDRVGILKIDTEGGDYAVVQGMGRLHSDVIMVEYWEELPDLFGPCPWKVADLAATLAARGYSNFAFVN